MSSLIAVVGPTGTGKSDLGIAIAKHIQQVGGAAEIVNADSMQFYKGMNIGTAKLPESEQMGVTHHLLDWLEITDESTAAEYQPRARAKILDLQSRGVTPILVGGSMLYIAAVLNEFGLLIFVDMSTSMLSFFDIEKSSIFNKSNLL
jgi:tRNA dimethylallyltransferase